MNNKSIRKLCFAGLLVAVAVIGSLLVIPVFGAKCSPVQHMVNVTAAVLLGPGYALGMGFAAALIRNLLGLGTLLAFPGSMIGALLSGLAYRIWARCGRRKRCCFPRMPQSAENGRSSWIPWLRGRADCGGKCVPACWRLGWFLWCEATRPRCGR